MKVAVLAVQGAFIEHEQKLQSLGIKTVELRQKKDLDLGFDALILPGGESTVQGKLLKELDMFNTLKSKIENGLPVLGTCSGMILLAQNLSNDEKRHFQTLPVTVKRNAYGRQLGSFHTQEEFEGIGKIPMTFIRAPYVEKVDKDVKILSKVDDNIVAVQYKNQIALSFHPELDKDTRIYKYFLSML